MINIVVVGAGGHVGLPFSVVSAKPDGNVVTGIDLNHELCAQLNDGVIPYIEHGLTSADITDLVDDGKLWFTDSYDNLSKADVVVVMIGTPVDEEGNPRLDQIFDFFETQLIHRIKPKQLIVLRSTVSPGTTEVLRDFIENRTGKKEGKDFFLVFCPERVSESHGIEETSKFPQLVGSFSYIGFERSYSFFNTFVDNECIHLTPKEAELGKLMTNMYRYVNFALANEFYMIAHDHDANYDRIVKAVNKDYPRMSLAAAGPNVGGPCLFKDGKFLLTNVPYSDLIQTSFNINEGMPDWVFKQIEGAKNVLILGAAFKAECDDTRNSLSFKFRKVCKKHGVETYIYDPLVKKYETEPRDLSIFDAFVVMTPHKIFIDWFMCDAEWDEIKDNCKIVDIWKLFPTSKNTKSGIYVI